MNGKSITKDEKTIAVNMTAIVFSFFVTSSPSYFPSFITALLYFKPMAFEYLEDEIAVQIEEQLLLENEIMLAPVYTQNDNGRFVYLP